MQKRVLFSVLILVLFISSYSIDISNFNGVYNLMKVEKDENIFQTSLSFESVETDRNTNHEFSYKAVSEERYNFEGIHFYEYSGEIYAVVDYGYEECVYIVTESTDFHLTLVNVDYSEDVIKLIYDKQENNFDYESYYNYAANFSDGELRGKLNSLVSNHKVYDYTGMREIMFGEVYNINGEVEDIYIGRVIKTAGIPNPNVMNCEHAWPQSMFGYGEPTAKKTDMFHTFPSDSVTNSRRGNNPFGWVDYYVWAGYGSALGDDKDGRRVFEVRQEYRGDIARALFYFAVRYSMPISEEEERVLRQWHKMDAVDEFELRRNSMIEWYQDNRNPFIDRPDFVDKISNF
jgi:hypothetical protein